MLGMNPYWLRSRTGWKTLPLELQLKVHRLLPVQDLKSAVLVNKDWNRVGEDPSLWSWVVVRVRSREDIAKLSVKRLAKIRQIQIEPDATFGTADWDLFFQNLEKLAQVKDISGLGNQDLKAVDSGLLARAMNGVENVDLFGPQPLTVQQLTSIFNHIAVQETKIKKLVLARQDLKAVDSGLLARALNGVETVKLWRTEQLTVQQLTSIFNHILEQDSKIKNLELDYQDLKGVDSSLLARAVNRLEDVELWDTQLTSQQLSSIFHHIAEQETKIKKLLIWALDLSGVPSDDLSVAVCKLEWVALANAKLTTAQLTSILLHIVEKETNIKNLTLSWNDLSAVDGNLFNRASNKLSESGGIFYHQ